MSKNYVGYIKDLKTGKILTCHNPNYIKILEIKNKDLIKDGNSSKITHRIANESEISEFLGVEPVDHELEAAKEKYKEVFGKNPDKRIKDADKLNKMIADKLNEK